MRVVIDRQIIDELQILTPTHSLDISVDLTAGLHLLEFERINKIDHNTLVDQQGNILQDQTVTLDNIWYEDVRLPQDFLWAGVFCYHNLSRPSVLHWGPNGVWSWPFETPVLSWIISKKNQQRSQAAELFVPTADRVAQIKQKTFKISHDLNSF